MILVFLQVTALLSKATAHFHFVRRQNTVMQGAIGNRASRLAAVNCLIHPFILSPVQDLL